MKKLIRLIASLGLVAALTTGCAVNRATAIVDPGAKLETLKTLHVKPHDKDGRSIDKLIAENLRKRGYTVTSGPQVPGQIDALVTYVDKWMWDITMYMLELTINIREPKTDFSLASGNSFHTSLTRKSPPEMVDEVVGNILKEGKVSK